MLTRFRSRLTYANVVSTLCLFILLGGVAVAVDIVPLAKKANFAKKAGKVDGLSASKKPKKNRLLALDKQKRFPASVLPGGLTGPTGPAGPAGATGPKGATGPAGTALGYAEVDSDAFLDASRSSNVAQANVYQPAAQPGVYCFKDLPFNAAGMVANSSNVFEPVFLSTAVVGPDVTAHPCAVGEARVIATHDDGTRVNAGFFAVFQ
ncbi:MAG TPA: collagen-like protein [Thermoleophilaceae bacterium]|nr:collagen-like protein [Thermoleophilaceae bacterium]